MTKPKILPEGSCLVVNGDEEEPERIQAYFNCAKCLADIKDFNLPTSPRQYKRLDIGFIGRDVLQVWCTRHECNVALITIGRVS